MELTQSGCQGDDILPRGVVQVPGNSPSLFILQAQKLAGKALQFLLGSHTFGDVTTSARNADRLSFFIVKSLPPLPNYFYSSVWHNDPVFHPTTRALLSA